MKINRICLIFSSVLIFLACSPSAKEINAEKRAEVMAVHDEVMPKMGQLKSFEKRALNKASELAAADTVDSVKVEAMKALATELDQAYEAMFVWMRQYDTEDGERSTEDVQVYLEDQMESVQKVNQQMKHALARADSILKN